MWVNMYISCPHSNIEYVENQEFKMMVNLWHVAPVTLVIFTVLCYKVDVNFQVINQAA